ncbi:MAG: hypothetical protein ACUVWJ_00550 [Spirochaetota bacterium]
MKVVFVHHHLRPGGVTRVIKEEIKATGELCKPLVICGEPPVEDVPFPFRVIPAIAYDRDRTDTLKPEETVKLILKEVLSFFDGEADLFHIHNPTLGKNSDFLQVIKLLIKTDARVLLHIHDFAEDGRPSNYSQEEYPENCHYAVLNRRDYSILIKAGLKEEGLHLLPNPVNPLPPAGLKNCFKRFVLYPVRAIRRKNIGEAILLSLFLRSDEAVGITLEPTSRIDLLRYRGWIEFVREKNLKVKFRLGLDRRFEDVLSETRCFITTSIREGFGFSFLEPWTAGCPVYGRILPEICRDFTLEGIELSHLYDRITIPFDLFDEKKFSRKWKNCYTERMRSYFMPISYDEVERVFSEYFKEGYVDFGMLDEELQKEVITKMLSSEDLRRNVVSLNPFLKNATNSSISSNIIEKNRRIVEEHYSAERISGLLLDVYDRVISTSPVHGIEKTTLIRFFNSPEKNHLLLCDVPNGK